MKRVSVLPNQRINIDDYEDGAGGRLAQKEHSRQATTFMLPTDTDRQARVFGGFDLDPVTLGVDTAITINRGTGVFPIYSDQNELLYGYVFGGEGDASFFLDMSGAGNATHDVYIKASGTLAEFKNRVFWDPQGAAEYVDNVSTRFVTQWSATYVTSGASPPGNGEWVKVYEVTKAGGVITAVTDKRKFYFEGAVSGTYPLEWGSGTNDRNANRASYGIQDLHKWAQAVRTQLDQIIGKSGWYKSIPASLADLAPLNDRFVTVDQPGGPGGDGDYATIALAVTALNAADGGTILLRSGVYSLSAQITVSKQINIIGVEDGVDIQNTTGLAADYAVIFDTGSEGSLIRGVQFSEDTDSLHLSIVAAQVKVERCKIFGGGVRSVGGDTVWENCDILCSTQDDTIPAIVIDAGTGVQTWRNCTINAGTEYTRDDTIKTSGTFTGAAVFEDCTITGNTDATNAPRLVYDTSTTGCVKLIRCEITVCPFQSSSVGQLTFASRKNSEMIGCSVTVKSGVASNLKAPVLLTTAGILNFSRVSIRNCYFNFGNYMPITANAPFSIQGYSTVIEGCSFANIKLPNSVTNATALEDFFEFAPVEGCVLDDCRFILLSSEGANDIDICLIGQPTANTNAGYFIMQNCYIDGSGKTYRNAGDGSSMIAFFTGAGAPVRLIDNVFVGGVWNYIVILNQRPGSVVVGNKLEFVDVWANPINSILSATGIDKTTDTAENCLVFSNNVVSAGAMVAAFHVQLYNAYRIVCMGNTVISVAAAPTDAIIIDTAHSATMIGNNTTAGVAYAAAGGTPTVPIPAGADLGTLNAQT